ncbi:FLOT2 protein, partial [Corythaeola cristata]|nr:FLOT2 protein [Corythaeola cristata]
AGGCCGSDVKQYVYGGWAWAWWCITDTQRISLEIMTLQPRCEDVETAEGVALTVTGVAQQFLGKNVQDVKNVVLQTLEGHLRSILVAMTAAAACPASRQLGEEHPVSCLCKHGSGRGESCLIAEPPASRGEDDVYDKVDYLSSLGKTQTAAVRRDADIGVAEAERDAGIREAECKKEMLDVKFMADTKIADSKRAFELQKSAFTEEVNIKGAVSLPRVKQVLLAQAEAEKIRKIGEAEAFVIEAIGMAEAERMKLKAEALQQYGEAAQLALVLDALPEIAAKVAAPLSKVDEIVILSGESSSTTSEVNRLLAEIPASVRAITGVDLTKV